MTETIRTDVCVVGGGPGGCAATLQLAKQGVPVVLVEKAIFPRDKVCGDALSGKVMRTLERLDPELADRVKHDASFNAELGRYVHRSERTLPSSSVLPQHGHG